MRKVSVGLAIPGWEGSVTSAPIGEGTIDQVYVHLIPGDLDPAGVTDMLKRIHGWLKPSGKLVVLYADARKSLMLYLHRQMYTIQQVRDMSFSGKTAWGPEEMYELLTKSGFYGVDLPDAEEWPYNPDATPTWGMAIARKPGVEKA